MTKNLSYSINIQVNGKDVEISTRSLKGLREAMDNAKTSTQKLGASMRDLASVQMAMNGLTQIVGRMQSSFQGLANVYAIQEQAERQLSTVMANTMGATADQVQEIKDLTAAQQQLGIIGDEVQLSGAAQLATFLSNNEALQRLIPAMNDMAVAQDGLRVSQSSVEHVAQLFGKVMQGNTNILKRQGIQLTDTQKRILETGDELDRAAVLADVVEQRFGGMNEQLRQTSPGQMKALNNSLGDLQEKLGKFASSAMPVVMFVSNITLAALGVTRLVATVASLNIVTRAHALITATCVKVVTYYRAAVIAWNMGAKAMVIQSVALKVAMGALFGAGIIGGIMLVTSLFHSLTGVSKEAGDEITGTAREVNDAFVQASAQAKAQINEDVRKLKGLMDAHADTSAAVRDLNARYGDIFGTFSTAAQWYDTLIGKSEAYCRQIGYEAQLKKIYEKKAETEIKLQQNEDRQAELKSQGKDRVIAYTSSGTSISGYTQSVAYETKSDEQNRLEKENQTLQGELREQERLEAAARKKIEDNNFRPVNPTGNTPPTTPTTTPTRNTGSTANVLKEIAGAKTYEQLANNIRYYDEQLRKTDPAEKAIIESWAKKKKIAEDAPVIRCLMLSLLSLESPKYLCLRRLASGIN